MPATAVVLLLLTLTQFAPAPGSATVQIPAVASSQASSPIEPRDGAVAPPRKLAPRPPRSGDSKLVPFVVATTAFDSNINHDREDLDSYGIVAGAGLTWRSNPVKPAFEVQYRAGLHRFTGTDKWNRLSHYARAVWSSRPTKRVGLDTIGEVSIKGSTEDQELSNQFVISPRVEYRLAQAFRVRGYGALRVKRYEDDPTKDALNRYGGAELVGKLAGGTRWAAGGRYEWNGAESRRQQYARWTLYADYARAVGAHDRVEVGTRYRVSQYPYRLVNVPHGPGVPRHDTRWDPEVGWVHAIDGDVEIRLGYGFSGRNSNDPRRDYRSHNVALSILQRW